MALDIQHPAKKNIVPWNPKVFIKNGNSFTIRNESDQTNVKQNDIPKSFNFSGNTSEITKYGRVRTAHDAIKMTNEKLATGIQL